MRSLLVCGLLATAVAFPQAPKKAQPSPPAGTSVTIGGKTISIKYSAPSLRGRKFIGGLHQYGQVWRAGANEATTLHTDANLSLGGILKVPAGDYTLSVLLDKAAWQLVVNKQTGQWGTMYNVSQDLGRVKMSMSKPRSTVETFKITLSEKGYYRGELRMEWEDSVATLLFTVLH